MKIRRTYTREFKLKVLRECENVKVKHNSAVNMVHIHLSSQDGRRSLERILSVPSAETGTFARQMQELVSLREPQPYHRRTVSPRHPQPCIECPYPQYYAITIPVLKCKVFKQHNTNPIADFRLLQPGLYSY